MKPTLNTKYADDAEGFEPLISADEGKEPHAKAAKAARSEPKLGLPMTPYRVASTITGTRLRCELRRDKEG